MQAKTKTYAEIMTEAGDALTAMYRHVMQRDAGGDHSTRSASLYRHLERDASQKVDAALAAGASVRQLATSTHVPGPQIIRLVSDPDQRREAYEVEIHHLQRAIREVEIQRGSDIRARWDDGDGETKQALAAEFGTTRVTLDAWIGLAVEDGHSGRW